MTYHELRDILNKPHTRNGSRCVERNTYVESRGQDIAVRYYHTDILLFSPTGDLRVDNGGYWTYSTRDRINRWCPHIGGLYGSGGWGNRGKRDWYFDSNLYWRIPFARGMVFRANDTISTIPDPYVFYQDLLELKWRELQCKRSRYFLCEYNEIIERGNCCMMYFGLNHIFTHPPQWIQMVDRIVRRENANERAVEMRKETKRLRRRLLCHHWGIPQWYQLIRSLSGPELRALAEQPFIEAALTVLAARKADKEFWRPAPITRGWQLYE